MSFLPYSRQDINDSDIAAVITALKGDVITGGHYVSDFENALCAYSGAKHAVVMNSATSALHCAYLALGLGAGDELLTTPITFAATANAALMCGADVRWADVSLESGNIDVASIKECISPRTKIIAPVDLGGNPVDMEAICQLAHAKGIKVVDDASHALGSSFADGRKIGSALLADNKNGADATIMSFHAIKPITTIEGGAVLTNDDEIARKCKLLRSHGISKTELWDSDMSMLGFNYRLSDVACALGLCQLTRLDEFVNTRGEIASVYDEFFASCKWAKNVKIPSGITSSRHLYIVLLGDNLAKNKAQIFSELHSQNIGVQVHYKPTYSFDFYRQKYGDIFLPNAELFYAKELSLPCQQKMSVKDAELVLEKLCEIVEKYL